MPEEFEAVVVVGGGAGVTQCRRGCVAISTSMVWMHWMVCWEVQQIISSPDRSSRSCATQPYVCVGLEVGYKLRVRVWGSSGVVHATSEGLGW